MADFSSILGIDRKTLRELILAYSAYAAYLAADETGDHRQVAACYLYAAAYEVLLDQEKAQTWFGSAAARYAQDNDPYGVIASICCKEISYLGYIDYLERKDTSPGMQFYQLLNLTFLGEPVKTSAWQESVGRLQIPFYFYAEAIQATKDLCWEQQVAQLPAVWNVLLSRLYEPVLLLRQDTLRWQQLEGTVIPLEPETIAACLVLLSIVEKNGISRSSIALLIAQQQDDVFLPMKIALQM